ncbi:hypothetical protein HFP05_07050 [Rhodanobacter denitrificans]|nr:hypothetical protein [Rhodanobacter denitrificans]
MEAQILPTKTAMVPASPPIRSCIRRFRDTKHDAAWVGGIAENASNV